MGATQPYTNTDASTGKKLKKRLEDLERRAGSSSASPSPEQNYAQLDRSMMSSRPPSRSAVSSSHRMDTPHIYAASTMDAHYPAINEDRSMFSYQHTRQLSASPSPLFPYQAYPSTDSSQAGGVSQATSYFSPPLTSSELSPYPYSLPPLSGGYAAFTTGAPSNIKVQSYEDDDINPFSLSYASMAGMDIPNSYSYQPPAIHVSQVIKSSTRRTRS